jgi:hypothetical protein
VKLIAELGVVNAYALALAFSNFGDDWLLSKDGKYRNWDESQRIIRAMKIKEDLGRRCRSLEM